MGHYTELANSCRVDFFRELGKWYATEVVLFLSADYDSDIFGAYYRALYKILVDEESNDIRYSGMWAVCLEPYHGHEHPLMVRVPESILGFKALAAKVSGTTKVGG